MMPSLHAALAHVVTGQPLPRSQDEIRRDLSPDTGLTPLYQPSPADRDAEAASRLGYELRCLRKAHKMALLSGDMKRAIETWANFSEAMGW